MGSASIGAVPLAFNLTPRTGRGGRAAGGYGRRSRARFQGDVPVERGIEGAIDLPHAAGANRVEDFVVAQAAARRD
jgi:hypothetical protein